MKRYYIKDGQMNDSREGDNKTTQLFISLHAVLMATKIFTKYLNKICNGQNTPAGKIQVNAT